jgi:hypothetical protein
MSFEKNGSNFPSCFTFQKKVHREEAMGKVGNTTIQKIGL